MIKHLFYPKSIIIVGSSMIKGGMANHKIFENIVKNLIPFEGEVFIVDADCLRPSEKLPEADLGIIVLPPKETKEIMKLLSVKYCIIIPGGFREKDRKDIVSIASRKGIRVLGPNSIGGVINTSNSLNTTFEERLKIRRGRISFISQSGGIGAAVLDMFSGYKIGFSKFTWVGDMADITDSEIIEYLNTDKETEVIGIYLEGLREPRKFMQAAKKCRKPIIVMKGGISEETKERILSHTAAVASEYMIYSGMFKQAGIIEADSLYEIIDIAMLLEHKKPKADRIAVVSNTGGASVVMGDQITRAGLKLSKFSEKTKNTLRKKHPEITPINPVDLIADADGERYRDVINILMKDTNIDCIVAIAQLKTCMLKHQELNIFNSKEFEIKKPIIFCSPGKEDFDKVSSIVRPRFPIYNSPERVARAIKHVLQIQKQSKRT